MVLSMELAGILTRIEKRLKRLEMSATKASKLAGKPDAIRNLKRAVKQGRRRGISTATLHALAPVLQTTEGWLLTGNGTEDIGRAVAAAISDESLSFRETVTNLTWAFQMLERASEERARILATALATAIRTQLGQDGSPLSDQDRRNLIQLAIDLFRTTMI